MVREPMTLTTLRKAKGLKQIQVAKALGLCRSAYNMIEHGHRRLSLDLAGRLAQVLGVSLEAVYLASKVHAALTQSTKSDTTVEELFPAEGAQPREARA